MSYGEFFDKLFEIDYIPSLGIGKTPKEAKKLLKGITISDAFQLKITNKKMANASLSGALLFFDLLEESHTLSQSINSKEGSYWHGIMHRKEGDFWNANYWFSKVGGHPIFSTLYENSLKIDTSLSEIKAEIKEIKSWNLECFNELVERAVNEGGEIEDFCLKIQEQEMRTLFDYCYKNAISP